MNTALLDGVIQIDAAGAFDMSRRAARVLTFCYDTGEGCLSVQGLFPVPEPISS